MKQNVDWHAYWINNRLGFHEGQVNHYLEKYLPEFDLKPGDTIFMPLCGKAVDMHWLAQRGYHIVGVELSEIAIRDFFKESGVSYRCTEDEHFKVYLGENITLYQGDFMHLQLHHLEQCRLIYDRASLVAIEAENRPVYVRRMFEMLPHRPDMLLISLDYDQNSMPGPPFSVSQDEIESLYRSEYQPDLLTRRELIEDESNWKQRGLNSLVESAYKLRAL